MRLTDEQAAMILYSVPEEQRNQFVAAALQGWSSGDVSGPAICRRAAVVLLELKRLGKLHEEATLKGMDAMEVPSNG